MGKQKNVFSVGHVELEIKSDNQRKISSRHWEHRTGEVSLREKQARDADLRVEGPQGLVEVMCMK